MPSISLHLVRPALRHRRLWYRYRKEFLAAGERQIPGLGADKTYAAFLRKLRRYSSEATVPAGWVPAQTWFLMDEREDKILGAVNVRRRLNDSLLHRGGQIGYAVAPSERRKGCAAEQLRLVLEKCREWGILRVLVTCDKDNIGSARTIRKNGGVLEDERQEGEKIFQRYWITQESPDT
ncbi:MAG: GNAT family N-acetyltransferase [Oscillospiraceae bacterium]|jgi:predicted acetyltransferase|nr:GNAT family N-acetyltransferase [Oscillospiraceae bacterium]